MQKNFASRIRALRGPRTQAEMAEILGIKQQVWARYETGKTIPGSEVLHQLCCKLGASADWLLGLSTPSQAPPITSEKGKTEKLFSMINEANPQTGDDTSLLDRPKQCPDCVKKNVEIERLNRIVENLSSALAKK